MYVWSSFQCCTQKSERVWYLRQGHRHDQWNVCVHLCKIVITRKHPPPNPPWKSFEECHNGVMQALEFRVQSDHAFSSFIAYLLPAGAHSESGQHVACPHSIIISVPSPFIDTTITVYIMWLLILGPLAFYVYYWKVVPIMREVIRRMNVVSSNSITLRPAQYWKHAI